MKIKTLMLGWEFPPYISGGLGTACYGLTKAMGRLGMEVTFLLPRMGPVRVAGSPEATLESGFPHVRLRAVSSSLLAYGRYGNPRSARRAATEAGKPEEPPDGPAPYGANICEEVQRYATRVMKIAESEEFDVIHAHDWMTFPAGVALAAHSGKPLVVQVHSTEFDRSGEHVNQYVYDIERHGMHAAAKIITVSHYTRNIVVNRYAVPPEKVDVVYNGIDFSDSDSAEVTSPQASSSKSDKVVLFLGRITMQKGPEYFLYAAKRVLEKEKNVKFVMAGDGDRLYGTIDLAAWLGIGHKVFFTRFLRGQDVARAYRMADLYVMPSVSEPFGIAPLEALQHNVPVLISKSSGIAEAFRNALKVDFWDINEMANKIVAVLRHPPLQETLRTNGRKEALGFRWEDSAARVNEVYRRVLNVA
jgi:glycosyltransferase involved in cell wall biosynthesis